MAYHELRWPLLLSIAAAVATIAVKTTAYVLTGSVGLFSDALESGVNLLAALAATFSLWYASKPSDPSHPYGHEKIEFFSSGLEGALVFVAGGATTYFAIERILVPVPILQLGLGMILGLVASVVNFAVAMVLLRVGKRFDSIILEADGQHLMTDVLTTLAVVGGLGLVHLTGWSILDSLVALAVGLYILWTGFCLVARSFDGLMDRALPDADCERLRRTVRESLPSGTDFHHLRTRRAGRRRFADFHLLVDGAVSVRSAHDLAHRIEAKMIEAMPDLEVTIHVEPIDERSSWESQQLERLGEVPVPAELPQASGE